MDAQYFYIGLFLNLLIMIIQLVKEYNVKSEVSYHIKLDDEYVPESTRFHLEDALEIYEQVKYKMSKARKEIIIQEQI